MMQPEFEAILASDLPEAEKLARAYQFIVEDQIVHGHREVELQQALNDEDELIKAKIKVGVLEYSYSIFTFCYLRVTGKKLAHG
jgi:hypothetical protein